MSSKLGSVAIKLWGNFAPVCPYCGKNCEPPKSDGVIWCEHCEKYFFSSAREETVYDTVGDCEQNQQMPHRLVLISLVIKQYECKNCTGQWYDWQLADGEYPKLDRDDYVFCEDVVIKGKI